MKKQIALAMGLAVVSGSAFATKARLEALGEDAYGSQFISDNRNIFLNAATVNFHKDMVTYEWGNTAETGMGQDSAASPKAEGGFLKASGNMVYGLHLGSESNTSHELRFTGLDGNGDLSDGSEGMVYEDRNIDFFIGGDAGIQWGASLTYSSTSKEGPEDTDGDGTPDVTNDQEQSAMRARLGAVSGNISAFAQINLDNSVENTVGGQDYEFDGKSGFDLGATYEMNDMYYMARYRHLAAEVDTPVTRGGADDEINVDYIWLGAAKAYKMNDRSNIWVSAWYKMETKEAFGNEVQKDYLPLTLAAEVEVKDWLTLRGSVGHTLIGTEETDYAQTGVDNTENAVTDAFVNAGATVSFGDFAVDGLIGNTTNTGVGGTSTDAGNGVLRTDALLSRVSFLYRF